MSLNADEAKLVEVIVTSVTGYADEWGRAYFRQNGGAPASHEKLLVAIEAAKTLARGKLKAFTEEHWRIFIEGKLGASRPPETKQLPPIDHDATSVYPPL